MYLCLAALSIGIFASCKAKKGVEATFSDLDGSWNIVELNGKVLNPAETNQVIDVWFRRLWMLFRFRLLQPEELQML